MRTPLPRRGVTATEYALVLMLIVVTAVGIVLALGQTTTGMYQDAYNGVALGEAPAPPTPPPPTLIDADFSATSATTGPADLTVSFSADAPEATTFLWDFGDGEMGTGATPSHTYTEPGRYTVSLIAYDLGANEQGTVEKMGFVVVDEVRSLDALPQIDTAFGSTVTGDSWAGAHWITDDDDNSTGYVSPAPPNNGFWYQLAEPTWVTRVQVKAMHNSSSYSSRIRVYGSTDGSNWIQIYDTEANTAESGLREFAIPAGSNGPWEYMRFQMVSRSISSGTNRWFTARTFGTDPDLQTNTPRPRFAADVNAGTGPLTVNFTDLSTGAPDEWYWQFGDGGVSTEQNPSHTFTDPGLYSVQLTIMPTTGAGQETYTEYGYIAVHQNLVSGVSPTLYSSSLTAGTLAETVDASNSTYARINSCSGQGDPCLLEWDFGAPTLITSAQWRNSNDNHNAVCYSSRLILYASNDYNYWVELHDDHGSQSECVLRTINVPQERWGEYRYVRLGLATHANSSSIRVQQAYVWGVPAD